jgi:hypothetical protein
MTLRALSTGFADTRRAVHVIGAHVLSRARHAVTGRIDLTPTPGGLGTPTFGPDHRVIRLSGGALLVEATGERPTTSVTAVRGATLRSLAAQAGADLDSEFFAGSDTPPPGDPDQIIDVDEEAIRDLGAWFALGEQVIDAVVATRPPSAAPTRARIWPEHFDLGIDVAAGGSRVNLGASPGDGFHDPPYLYVSPWEAARPGTTDFWNAPFGAVLGYDDLRSPDALDRGVAFMVEGLGRLG